MIVYILFSQEYVSWEYGYANEIIGVYETREDAERMQSILEENSSREYCIEEWNVEQEMIL